MSKIKYNGNILNNNVIVNIENANKQLKDAIYTSIYFTDSDYGYNFIKNSLANNYREIEKYKEWLISFNNSTDNSINRFEDNISKLSVTEIRKNSVIIK